MCNSFNSAVKTLNDGEFDVFLVDHNLPDGHGLEFIHLAKNFNRDSIFVMMTGYSKERLAIDSLNAGVFQYLEKPVDRSKLLAVMQSSKDEVQRKYNIKRLEDSFIVQERTKLKLMREFHLSDREIEVLQNVLIQMNNKLVAKDLNLSEGTVRNYLSVIYEKLHCQSRQDLKNFIQKLNTAL